ncbi:MAG: hypothetical protein AAFX52_00865 [Pseudomonadota bacterium]
MNALAALLATAAVAAGSVTAVKAIRKRLRDAPDHIQWLRKRKSGRKDGAVIDLVADESGVYGMPERN